MFAIGEDHKNRKKIASKIALDKIPPSQREINMLHEMMLKVAEREKQMEDAGTWRYQPVQSSLEEEIVSTSDTEVSHDTLIGWARLLTSIPAKVGKCQSCSASGAESAREGVWWSLDAIGK